MRQNVQDIKGLSLPDAPLCMRLSQKHMRLQDRVTLFCCHQLLHHLICSKIIKNEANNLSMKSLFSKKRRPSDRWMLLTVLSLSLFGLLMVYDSSVAIAIR